MSWVVPRPENTAWSASVRTSPCARFQCPRYGSRRSVHAMATSPAVWATATPMAPPRSSGKATHCAAIGEAYGLGAPTVNGDPRPSDPNDGLGEWSVVRPPPYEEPSRLRHVARLGESVGRR